ncbi:hypothetical protein [Psychrosphaera haliotis]|uniref:Uncharacterized protein n=1 Tax=Psychrosphaera haliotis TaxID=555083 RepID=A0A6N8F5F1_9GAMM|nr:hypothetical protein [Psychrosphaera haliotis]MUH71394.1 hypothetical protein [Psychrosphaera haliotis]
MQISKFKQSLLLSSILLAACGGGSDEKAPIDNGGNGGGTVQSVEIPVTAIDGYIRGAIAYVDINSNGELDDDEPSTTTSIKGAGEIDVTDLGLNLDEVQITVIVPAGAIDEDTITEGNPDGTPITAEQAFELKTLPGSENATPLTTLVAFHAAQSGDIDASIAAVAAQLNVSAEDLDSDFIEDENKSLSTLAEVMVKASVLPTSTSEALSPLQVSALLSVATSVKAQSDEVASSENADANMAALLNSATAIVKATHQLVESQSDQLEEISQEDLDLFVDVLASNAKQAFANVDNADDIAVAQASLIFDATTAVIEDVIAKGDVSAEGNAKLVQEVTVIATIVSETLISANVTVSDDVSADDVASIALIVAEQVSEQVQSAIEAGEVVDDIVANAAESAKTLVSVVIENVESGNDVSDLDGDGIANSDDDDIDGDGVLNTVDVFAYDASESVDADMDGVGDNADTFIGDKINLIKLATTQKIDSAQSMTRVGEQLVVPTVDGLFIINHDDVGDEESEIEHVLKSEFEALDLSVVHHVEALSETKVLVATHQNASENQEKKAVYLTLEYINQSWTLAKSQEELDMANLVEGVSTFTQEFFTEIFQLSSDKKFVYALVTDYSNTFVASYRLNSDDSLTLVSSMRVDDAVGRMGYEKSLSLSSDDQWLYYVSPDGVNFSGAKMGRMAVSSSTGQIETLSIDSLNTENLSENSIQISSLPNNRMLISKDTSLELFNVLSDGRLSLQTTLSHDEDELASLIQSMFLSVSPDASKAAISYRIYDDTGRTKLIEIGTQNELTELSDVTTENFSVTTTWSENSSQFYNIGLRSGVINAISTDDPIVKSESLGIPYTINNFEVASSDDGLMLITSTGQMLEVAMENNEVVQNDLSHLLQVPGYDEQYLTAPYLLNQNAVLARATLFNSNGVERYVTAFTFNEDKTEATYNHLITSSRSGLYPYQAWAVNSDYIVTFNRDYREGSDSYYSIAFYEYTSATTVELINTIPMGYVSLVYGTKETLSNTEFRIDNTVFDFSSGELELVGQQNDIILAQTLGDNQYQITVEAEVGFQLKKLNAETGSFDATTAIDSENIIAINTWGDTGFVALDAVGDEKYIVRVYSVDEQGAVTLVNSARINKAIYEDAVKLEVSPEQNQIWLFTYNQDRDVLVLDVEM